VSIPRVALRPDFDVPQIIKGNWQIADDHSDAIGDDDAMYEHMTAFFDAGITAFDCGDVYYGVEERIGRFIARLRRERGAAVADQVAVHSKYIPAFLDEEELRAVDRAQVQAVVDRSLTRLQVDRIDLMQLHWWNYDIPGHVEAALHLQDLADEGKIKHVGVTNYNTEKLAELVDGGVRVVSNQVQYSVTDRRPANGLDEYCLANDVALLCYGTIAGGLFSRKWLGIPDPGAPRFENVSLDKYYRIIVDFGGWDLFQELLRAMDQIAERHGVSIPAIASRWVLDQPAVAAVIQGARHARHVAENVKLANLTLTGEDREQLAGIHARSTGPQGDAYDLDRIEDRDALEHVATDYFDVEDGQLVTRRREEVVVAEPYGHHKLEVQR
jgi:aryl-alcohol dehydrogenase-like predicted oxidoreductase